MKVFMLKGPAGSGKSTWAGKQWNAIVVTRWHTYNLTTAVAYAAVQGKDIIFDVEWTQEREDFLRQYFKNKAEVHIVEFTTARAVPRKVEEE